jgi:Ca2+/Na+ antiporter
MNYETINYIILFAGLLGAVSLVLGSIFLPNRIVLAIPLCIALGPFGHFYIKKGTQYFFAVILFSLLVSLLTENDIAHLVITVFFSVILMWLRFKISRIRTVEQGS